jgi:hypothetical protein
MAARTSFERAHAATAGAHAVSGSIMKPVEAHQLDTEIMPSNELRILKSASALDGQVTVFLE